MSSAWFEDTEYLTPDTLDRRIEYAEDPIVGEAYHNMMEDYRWWGHSSPYARFHSYFETIRYREMHRLYDRSPFAEMQSVISLPGQNEEWKVLPYADKAGNAFTAYPPGVMPPEYSTLKSADFINPSDHDAKQFKLNRARKSLLDAIDQTEWRDLHRDEGIERYIERMREVHDPFWRGEHIVPDVTTKVPRPAVGDGRVELSPYSVFDQVAADTFFAPRTPIGDLSTEELAKERVQDKHLTSLNTTRLSDQAAAWGEQAALRQAYERALYSHHIAALIAAEQRVPYPSPPLPDPRLSKDSVTEARKRFTVRLATLNELNYPMQDLSDPVHRQRYQAAVGAYVVAGQESGFLPLELDKLPLIFREALEKLRTSEFIISRDRALAIAKKGHEQTLRMRQEILDAIEQPHEVRVHWSGPNERYERVERPEPWERRPLELSKEKMQQLASADTSSATDASIAASNTTNPSLVNGSSRGASTALVSGSTSAALDASKYYSKALGEFDWASYNRDVYRSGMSPAEFDIACEAMLEAIDLHFQSTSSASSSSLISSSSSQSTPLSLEERLEGRKFKMQSEMEKYDAQHPRPELPKKVTRDRYEVYEKRMQEWINDRELHIRQLIRENPISMPPAQEILSVIGLSTTTAAEVPPTTTSTNVTTTSTSAVENLITRTATWAELLSAEVEENMTEFYRALGEFLQKDVNQQLSLDEVQAFAHEYMPRLHLLGLGPQGYAGGGAREAERLNMARNDFVHVFRPISAYTKPEIEKEFGEQFAYTGQYKMVDQRKRALRAQDMVHRMQSHLRAMAERYAPTNVMDSFKTTRELEMERREAVLMQRDAIHEAFLMANDQQIANATNQANRVMSLYQISFDLGVQYRNMAIIATDPELKHLGGGEAPLKLRPPEHIPLPRFLHWPARIIAVIERVVIRYPQYYAIKASTWLGHRFGFHATPLASWLFKRVGLDLTASSMYAATVLDAKTRYIYHPYYMDAYHRLHQTLMAPETAHLPLQEAWESTTPYLPSWLEWRFKTWRDKWYRRLKRSVSTPFRFFLIPTLALTAVATVAVLEQRQTWFHDILRRYPAGLETSLEERRKWAQRNQLWLPPFMRKTGPAPIFFGPQRTAPDQLNAPYYHRTNSFNAADYQPID